MGTESSHRFKNILRSLDPNKWGWVCPDLGQAPLPDSRIGILIVLHLVRIYRNQSILSRWVSPALKCTT